MANTTAPKTETVRDLIPSVTALARHLGLSVAAIYRWISVNRIPGKYLVKVAQFYDVEIPMHLAASDLKNKAAAKLKPAATLPTLLEVFHGRMSISEAATQLGIHERSVTLALVSWGTDLPKLVKTLTDLQEARITLDDAARTLNVSKYNIHALRRKYGITPKKAYRHPVEKPIAVRKAATKEATLACIEGRWTLEEAEKESGRSLRTIHRAISTLSPDYGLVKLTHWPKSFRKAYSDEISHNLPKITPILLERAEKLGLLLKKWPKYPEKQEEWRKASLKRALIAVLLDEESLESLAAARGGDPNILRGLFTSDLQALDLTFDQVMSRPGSFQIAVAEFLMAMDDRRRRLPKA